MTHQNLKTLTLNECSCPQTYDLTCRVTCVFINVQAPDKPSNFHQLLHNSLPSHLPVL